MPKTLSPLRYPGGHSKIYGKVKDAIVTNHYDDRIYVEPFAGGFGIGLALLSENIVHKVVLNDYDVHIYHFWDAVFHHSDELIRLIVNTPVTLEERDHQKQIYNDRKSLPVDDGFATLFLNRVNYSGILKAGAIGGLKQTGKYLIDCRFNKNDIITKIRDISSYGDRVSLCNMDASALLHRYAKNKDRYFFYMDPPYVLKGDALYSEYFTENDHRKFASSVKKYLSDRPWIMTYDKCELIKELYKEFVVVEYSTPFHAANKGKEKEYVITNKRELIHNW